MATDLAGYSNLVVDPVKEKNADPDRNAIDEPEEIVNLGSPCSSVKSTALPDGATYVAPEPVKFTALPDGGV